MATSAHSDHDRPLRAADSLRNSFRGALLGGFCGDAMGAAVEGWTAERIRSRYGDVRELLDAPLGRGHYTDDTQMTVVLAEALLAHGRSLEVEDLARGIVESFDPERAYGLGMVDLMRRLKEGMPLEPALTSHFPHGSFGSGAASRVAPAALLLWHDADALERLAEETARATHVHPLGVAGAVLQARQVRQAIEQRDDPLDPIGFVVELRSNERSVEFRAKLRVVEEFLDEPPSDDRVRERLGNNSKALGSVATALYAFLRNPESIEDTIAYAISLGGDTDSIAAMAGTLAGAHLGVKAIPQRWLEGLEGGEKGVDYVRSLADRLVVANRDLRRPRRH